MYWTSCDHAQAVGSALSIESGHVLLTHHVTVYYIMYKKFLYWTVLVIMFKLWAEDEFIVQLTLHMQCV